MRSSLIFLWRAMVTSHCGFQELFPACTRATALSTSCRSARTLWSIMLAGDARYRAVSWRWACCPALGSRRSDGPRSATP